MTRKARAKIGAVRPYNAATALDALPATVTSENMVADQDRPEPREISFNGRSAGHQAAMRKQLGVLQAFDTDEGDDPAAAVPINEGAETLGADGWKNVENGLGIGGIDSGEGTFFRGNDPVPFPELEAIFRSEGLGRKLIELKVREMFGRGFEVKGDKDSLFVKAMKRRGILKKLKTLAVNGRLYGGALGVIIVNDGKDLKEELDMTKVKSLDGLNVFDRWQCVWFVDALYTDPNHPKYMMPARYQIFPIFGTPFWVHETRLLRYDGAYLTERQRQLNSGWGDSVLQGPYNKLRKLGEVMGWSSAIIRDFITETLSMKNLSNLVGEDKGEKTVQRRFRVLRRWKSIINIIPLDADGETFDKKASSVSGLDKLLDQFVQWLCMDADTPYSVLATKMTGGMGGGNEAETQMEQWHANVREDQEDKLDPLVEYLLRIEQNAAMGVFNGKVDDALEVDWLPLKTPTQKEMAEIRKANADADKIYLENGVYTPEEVADTRSSAGGDFQPIRQLFVRKTPTQADLDEDEEEDAAAAAAAGAGAGKGGKKVKDKTK